MHSRKGNVNSTTERSGFSQSVLKENRKSLKDQCQVFTLGDVATPSLSTKTSFTATESQRLEAIQAAEEEIAKNRAELVLEKQKIWQFWRNVNVQPLARYVFSLPPASWSYTSIVVCCIVKIIFCMFIFSMLMHSQDAPLLYMMCLIIVHVGSTFATIELIVHRTMKMLGICAIADGAVIIIMIVLLAMVSSDREGEMIVPIERVAATTVVLEFLELLCLVHHFHVQSRQQDIVKNEDVELPCTCRIEKPSVVTIGRNTASRSNSTARTLSKSKHGVRQVRGIPIQKVNQEIICKHRPEQRSHTMSRYSSSISSPRPVRYVRNPFTGEIRKLSHLSL